MADKFDELFELIKQPSYKEPWLEWRFKENQGVHDFIKMCNDINNFKRLSNHMHPILFRGQADTAWSLKPALLRHVENIPNERALELEYHSIMLFKQEARIHLKPQLIPKEDDWGDWLCLMQQYSAPTRMLDWTASFNIALYFAAMDEPRDKSGAVWLFHTHPLINNMREKFDKPMEIERWQQIMGHIDSFIEYGANKAQKRIDIYELDIKTDRVVSQKGVFTYTYNLWCDHADVIGSALRESINRGNKHLPLIKIILTPEVKKKLRYYLSTIDVDANKLFPGIDGFGRSIKESILLHHENIPAYQKNSGSTE